MALAVVDRQTVAIEAFGPGLGSEDCADLHAFLTVDSESNECADDAADLNGLVHSEIAEMGDLDVAVGVLVDRECIDHTDRAALFESFELVNNLPVEVGVIETEHEELNRTYRHDVSHSASLRRTWLFTAS